MTILAIIPKLGTKRLEAMMLAKNTSISLGDHFQWFVQTKVREGRYSSASDVVRAGLRLLEEHEAKLAALRQALIEGEESGPSEPFDIEAFIAAKRVDRKSTRLNSSH